MPLTDRHLRDLHVTYLAGGGRVYRTSATFWSPPPGAAIAEFMLLPWMLWCQFVFGTSPLVRR